MTGAALRFPPRCHSCAKSCSIDHGINLIGRDGISKTILWKKYAPNWNFAHAETFPVRHAGADCELGLFHS
jgi:hypothetical protein